MVKVHLCRPFQGGISVVLEMCFGSLFCEFLFTFPLGLHVFGSIHTDHYVNVLPNYFGKINRRKILASLIKFVLFQQQNAENSGRNVFLTFIMNYLACPCGCVPLFDLDIQHIEKYMFTGFNSQ